MGACYPRHESGRSRRGDELCVRWPQDLGRRPSGGGDAVAPVAEAIVEKYGGDGVPAAVENESIVRLVGYFLEGRFGAFAGTGVQIPPQSHAAAFRNSGAQALVSPWKVRRAGWSDALAVATNGASRKRDRSPGASDTGGGGRWIARGQQRDRGCRDGSGALWGGVCVGACRL